MKVLLIDMLNRAMEDQFLIRNPAKGVRLPKNKPQNEIKALSKEDQTDFFECAAGTFYNNMFVVAVNTGYVRENCMRLRKRILIGKIMLFM